MVAVVGRRPQAAVERLTHKYAGRDVDVGLGAHFALSAASQMVRTQGR